MKNIKSRNLIIFSTFLIQLILVTCKKEPNTPINNKTSAIFNSSLKYGDVKDAEGNTYKTIQIGSQIWMAENLRCTKFRNGEPIPNVIDLSLWASLKTAAFCTYNNTDSHNIIGTYGRLYNWYAVKDPRNIAPYGWHVPSMQEWSILTAYLGGENIACGKLKEGGYTHWEVPNSDATNDAGFTGLPAGGLSLISENYGFSNFGISGNFWSTTDSVYVDDPGYALYFYLYYNTEPHLAPCGSGAGTRADGISIRCVKD